MVLQQPNKEETRFEWTQEMAAMAVSLRRSRRAVDERCRLKKKQKREDDPDGSGSAEEEKAAASVSADLEEEKTPAEVLKNRPHAPQDQPSRPPMPPQPATLERGEQVDAAARAAQPQQYSSTAPIQQHHSYLAPAPWPPAAFAYPPQAALSPIVATSPITHQRAAMKDNDEYTLAALGGGYPMPPELEAERLCH
ncbi:hypothetical protein PI125_g21384 [Phytophthora idaei]|nr:hypothetical protein PI125_g21384 [Phytophthora idaei]